MWSAPVPIYDDEDESELIAAFVTHSARYPDEHPAAITNYIFKGKPDGVSRALQAATVWPADLSIRERIREAKANGGNERKELTKDDLQARLLAVVEDETIGAQEKKARIDGYLAIAEINGWKIKAVEKTDKTPRPLPRIVYAQHNG